VKLLLGVNALLAWGLDAHPHHDRTRRWLAGLRGSDTTLCTTPITELGFLRVAAQPAYARQLADGRRILDSMRRAPGFAHEFLPDDVPGDRLPASVKTPAQTIDGHLLAVAAKHGAKLAPLSTGMPGARLVAYSNSRSS
jgi:predicted nucleic acid-binding protein